MAKKIYMQLLGHSESLFDPNALDGLTEPYIHLRHRLTEKGYAVEPFVDQSLENTECVIFFNIRSALPYGGRLGFLRYIRDVVKRQSTFRSLLHEINKNHPQIKYALSLTEGSSVAPSNWSIDDHADFPVILTWNDSVVDNRHYFKFHLPYRYPPKVEGIAVPFHQRKLLVNISTNKYRSHPADLCRERRSSARYFEQNFPEGFDLFGSGWERREGLDRWTDRAPYTSYRGRVKDKGKVMGNYRFSLCYENVRGEIGYVSEKIFDSMVFGTVPIYWGAPNVSDFVDPAAFIDRSKFKTNAELANFIVSMSESEFNRYQDAMKNYLISDSFKKFLPDAYADTIIRVLNL